MKTHEETIKTFLQKNALQLTVQVVGLIVVIANMWIAYSISPLRQDIALIKQQVMANEKAHEKFITDNELDLLITRIDKLSDRVDEVISILIKK